METALTEIKVPPGLYKNFRSGLITRWDVRVVSSNIEKSISLEILHTIEHTMKNYYQERYGRYRILDVSTLGSQTGVCISTRFIDKYMILDSLIDYIMHLQRLLSVSSPGFCGQYNKHDLRGAKDIMMKLYDELRYLRAASYYN